MMNSGWFFYFWGKNIVDHLIFIIIVAFIVIEFIIDHLLEFLNRKNWMAPIPEVLQDVVDTEQRMKTISYQRANFNFNLIQSTFSFLAILTMLYFQGFAFVDQRMTYFTDNPLIRALFFFGVLGIAMEVLSIPFSIYHTFKIEEKFGFNKSTFRTYVFDTLKGWGLALVFGGGLMSILFKVWELTSSYFWVIAWAFISGFSVFMAMFYSQLIVPLFNKQEPLPEGSLRSAIEQLSIKAGFQLKNIYTIDGSKRSTKANAYFTGLGSQKRVVLYDTLLQSLTEEEVVAVLAHEIGHYKKRHVLQQLMIGILQTGLMLYLFSLIVMNPDVAASIGVATPSFHIGLLVFGLLYTPISMISGLFSNIYSRKCEFEADRFVKTFGLSDSLISALKKLSVQNLSDPTPHRLYVFFNYSHPDLASRMYNLMN